MLDKLRNIQWFDWLIVIGIGLVAIGIGMNWKVEHKGKIEILAKKEIVKDIEEIGETKINVASEKKEFVKTEIGTGTTLAKIENNILGVSVTGVAKVEVIKEEIKGKINLNKSKLEELCELPGIGPKTAQKIIDYRNQNGGFMDAREIILIKGIGEKTYEKIKNSIEI